TRGLMIRAVRAALLEPTVPTMLVGDDAEVVEGASELVQGAFDLAGLVGVFHPHEVDAAGVGGDVAVDGGHVDAADMYESGGGGTEPGDLGAVGKLAGRVVLFPVLGFGQVSGE